MRDVNIRPDELALAVLRGGAPDWPADSPGFSQAFLHAAEVHGIAPLLRLSQLEAHWPREVTNAIREAGRSQAMWDLQHHQILRPAIEALEAAGAEPVVLKGTALAFSVYAQPWLRSRADTDILVAERARAPATAALSALGFHQVLAAPSEQASFVHQQHPGHVLDVHWAFNNSPLLAKCFRHEELRARSIALPDLARCAAGTSKPDSLVIACLHKATHACHPYYVDGEPHYDDKRLIWLYDIDLLARALTQDEWRQVTQLCAAKGLRTICRDGLSDAMQAFGTAVPAVVLEELRRAGDEAATDYLTASPLRQQWLDFRAHESWSARMRWLRDLVFPPAAYLRARFGGEGPLGYVYLKRLCAGAWRRLFSRRRYSAS